MYKLFYRYASSDNPVIDQHLVTMALDQWSWFWMIVEASTVTLFCALALALAGRYGIATWLLISIFLALMGTHFILPLCAKYAHRQVKAIAEDGERRKQVRQEISAL